MIKNMTTKILLTFALMLALTFSIAHITAAATVKDQIQGGVDTAAGGGPNKDPGTTLNDTFTSVINVLSVLGGAIAVIMLIVGGFRYTTSAGNQEAVKSAKNTIIYALIGLVIVAVAQLLVHFVLDKTSKATTMKPSIISIESRRIRS